MFISCPATRTALNIPGGVSGYDATGTFYVADSGSFVVRRVFTNGTASIVAGVLGVSGNSSGGAGTASLLQTPRAVTLTTSGDLLITMAPPASAVCLLRLSSDCTLTIFAGKLGYPGTSGDGGQGEASTYLHCLAVLQSPLRYCLL